jgi:3-oxoadipate enol-lactonase
MSLSSQFAEDHPDSSPAESGFAAVDGATLYYEVSSAGQPLVLIHGFSLDHRMWDPQLEAFAARYRVLRYDCRGFGRSSLPTDAPYWHNEDLHSLLASLGIPSTIVVGMSLGGGTAIDFALAYPEMTCALVLIDSTLGGFRWSEEFLGPIRSCSATARTEGVEAARQGWYDHPMFASAQRHPDVMVRLRAIVADYSGWHWLHSDPRRSLDPPAITRLRGLGIPALALVGERDFADFHAIARLIEEQARNARRVVVPDAGHLANMEAPAACNEAILRFLAEAAL